MTLRVHLPSLLRSVYGAPAVIEVEAGDVSAMAAALDGSFPGITERLVEPAGQLRRYVQVFIRAPGETERWQGEPGSALAPGSEVWIVPNVAGG